MPILPQPTVRRQQYRDGLATGPAMAVAATATAIAVTVPASTNSNRTTKLASNHQQAPQLSPHCSPSVSKIPRQVHGTNKMPIEGPKLQARYYQQCGDSPSTEDDVGKAENNCYNNRANKITANPNYNKYLTFSKDQATSHFNALKEELGVQVSPPISPKPARFVISTGLNQLLDSSATKESSNTFASSKNEEPDSSSSAYLVGQQEDHQVIKRTPPPTILPDTSGEPRLTNGSGSLFSSSTYRTTSPIARPRLSKQKQQQSTPSQLDNISSVKQRNEFSSDQATSDNNLHRSALPKTSTNGPEAFPSQQQPQPTCEAFIMTGQSMLKLSCNESEIRVNGRRVINDSQTNYSSNSIRSSGQINNKINNNSNNNHSIDNITEHINNQQHQICVPRAHLDRSNEQLSSSVGHLKSELDNLVRYRQPELELNQCPAQQDQSQSPNKKLIRCAEDKCDMTSIKTEIDKIHGRSADIGDCNSRSNTLPTRRIAPGSNAPTSTMSASSGRHLKRGLNKMNGSGFHNDDPKFAIEFKSGFLFRKRVFEPRGKPTAKGRRGWRQAYFILQDLRLVMRYNYQPSEENSEEPGAPKSGLERTKKQQLRKSEAKLLAQDLKNTVKIHHTFAKRSTIYKKREHVFHLKLANQSEYLVQASNEKEMLVWIDTINFASACFSSPALPSALTNGKKIQRHRHTRSILPTSYTKLSYWEQLIDHEERLQKLKIELEDHLNEAPNTKNANKRFQTEFIEKIAYLKHEIERYSVYVDLMRKKSNSPEAIVLSKNPQIACLKPSDEMIKSLPSFAPQNMESIEGNGSVKKQNGTEIETTDWS